MEKSGTGSVRVLSSGYVVSLYGTVWNAPATVKGLKITKEPSPANFAEFFPIWHYLEGLDRVLCAVYRSSGYLWGIEHNLFRGGHFRVEAED